MLRKGAISNHASGSASSSDSESFSDGPSDCRGAEEDDFAQEHAQILDVEICLATQSASFLETVAAWFCMAVILPALAQAIKEYVASTAMCTDPPSCSSVPWSVRFFPAHIVSVPVMITIWNTYQWARRVDWMSRWRSRPHRKPLRSLSAIPPSLQSDHSLYEDMDILLGRVSEAAQTRLHAHVPQRQQVPRSLLRQVVATILIASFVIGLAWVPFFAMCSIFRRRFEECVKPVDMPGLSGRKVFEESMKCEIEKAIDHHGLSFTDKKLSASEVAKAKANVWDFGMLGHFFLLPFIIQSFNLFQLAPIEIFGGIFAVGYVVLTVFVRIDMEKLKGRAALAKTQMHDDFRHCPPVSAGRPLQGAGEKAMELPSLLDAYTMVMREVLPSHPWTASQLACVLLIASLHLASTHLMRASAVGGRTVDLSNQMRFFAVCNHISYVACSVHFYLFSTRAALVYRRSIPRLHAWRGMWHRRTCVIFREHVDGLSCGTQRKHIRHNFIFLNLDTVAKVDVWRRMQSWVRFDVLQDRIEAEGLALVSIMSMMMLVAVRILFVLPNTQLKPAPTVWAFLAIDILVFGRPFLQVLATCSDIAKEHRLDVQYLSELREAVLRRETSDLLSHLLATVLSQEDHTQEYEKLLSIAITPGIRTAASAVVTGGFAEALKRCAQRLLTEHVHEHLGTAPSCIA